MCSEDRKYRSAGEGPWLNHSITKGPLYYTVVKLILNRLLNKLKLYNISDKLIAWIQDFLCNRKQSICVNGEFSTWSEVLSGIPQGSILGPLLFLIYIYKRSPGHMCLTGSSLTKLVNTIL